VRYARQAVGIALIASVLILMGIALVSLTGEDELVIYVAADGDDAWSGSLPAPSADGSDGPLRSLPGARDRVREVVALNLTQDVRVVIREGTYYLPEGLTLGPTDSGTPEHSITYAAYPGEDVWLVGGTEVEGWSVHEGEIMVAEIPEGRQPLQLFEDGWRMEVARTPKMGYLKLQVPVAGEEQTAFVYGSGEIDPEGWDTSDATVFIWPGHDWFSHEKPILEIDREARTIRMGSDAGYPMIRGNRYYIRNVLSLLTAPGECQIDRSERRIYAWPSQSPIEERTMVVSTAPDLIKVQGSVEDPVTNVHFENLNLAVSNGNCVSITRAQNCSVRFCKIENAATNGVLIHGEAQGVTIYGNLIRYNGHHGVSISGLGWGSPDVNHHHVVENNHIHHCGRLQGHGYGVRISQSGHNRIVHNEIHDMPRYGTTIKGLRYQVLKDSVEGVTWENHWDYLHSRNNLIAYNHIYRVNLDSQDTGAMESWGPGRDNVYDHNLVHDVGDYQFTLQSGMYLDDATDYFTVTNNIIYGVVGAGGDQPIFTKGIGNRIENNILIVGRDNVAGIRSMEMGGERGDSHEYLRNIIYIEEEEADVYGFINWNDTRVAASDFNLFWKAEGELSVGGGPADGPLGNWLRLFNGRFDGNSVVADPLFVNPAKGDYRLREGSPALGLGFREIDTSEIGLKADFPLRLREGWEELNRIPRALVYEGEG
jgi:hypothetical protein